VYTHVRNPIYTGMAAFAIAHAVLTPSVWAVLGAVAMADGVEPQVRRVEEPYLQRVHGAAYGRFIPALG
jgi:protein-S-isoprenylcysteine O-methyltransferase Ste14